MKKKILLVYEDYTDLIQAESVLKKVGFDVIGLSNEFSVPEKVLAFNPDLVITMGSGARLNIVNIGRKLKDMKRWDGQSVVCFLDGLKPSPQELLQIRADHIFEGALPAAKLIEVVLECLKIEDSSIIEKFNLYSSTEMTKDDESVSVATFNQAKDEKVVVTGGADKNIFEDVDISSIEKELYTGKIQPKDIPLNKIVPNASGIEMSEEASVPAEISEGQKIDVSAELKDLKEAHATSKSRIANYEKHISHLKGMATRNINRVETRKKQKEMAKEWDKQIIQELDHLRREYVKAMFKK